MGSASKPKQQKSLLSFFSPSASAAADKATPTTADSAASATKSSGGGGSAGGNSKKRSAPAKDTAATRKRIEFSPKLKKKAEEAEETDSAKEAIDNKASPAEEAGKRKAYEDFLGTSSEEEDDDDKSGASKRLKRNRHQSKNDADGAVPMQVDDSAPKSSRPRTTKVIVDDDDSDEEAADQDMSGSTKPQARVRQRVTRNVVSSDEEWDPSTKNGAGDEESEFSASASDGSDDDDDDEEEEEEEQEEPAKKRRKPAVAAAKKSGATPAKKSGPASFLSPPPTARKVGSSTPSSSVKKSPAAASSEPSSLASENTAGTASGAGSHTHDSLPFLREKRRDINGNKPESPEYDSRTLLVPPEFLKKETPAMVQWWDVKARNMDTVLFFKVGKFYELFHMDADVGFKELGLIYMKGDKAHSGFPETAYAKMSSQLVEKGYRVARVEQTETPEMLKERNANSKTKAKVVRREICSLLSVGTHTNSYLDARISSSQDQQASRKLVALKEQVDAATKAIRFGICMADCATGAFHLAEFDDTEQRDRLKTLFAQFHVVEIVSERFGLSDDTKMVVKYAVPSAIRSELRVGKEFWDANRTVDEIERAGYFTEKGWPAEVLEFLEVDKTPRADGQLAISALGGCIWHLRRSIIDQELLSLCNFGRYKPSDEQARELSIDAAVASSKAELAQHYVVLDSQTLQNLEILNNSFNGSRAGSLIDIMDKTVTSFGKRMFQDWVVKPLCKVSEINERLDAVEQLGQQHELVMEVRLSLRKLPDLERLLSRIHALGSAHRSKEHPDSRAIMYESKTYNIRKIRDFLAVLNGFDVAMDLVRGYGPRFAQFASPILRVILKSRDESDAAAASSDASQGEPLGHFPDLREKLEFFKRSFDQSVAKESGVIVPPEGFDPEYDDACADITRVEEELQEYLQEQRTALKCKSVVYWGAKKEDRFQLEVPESAVSAKQPKEYELKSRKKGYKRFHTPRIRDLLAQLAAAEARKDEALRDQMRKVFHKFDEDYKYWMKAVQCLSVLDCLLSLALVSSQSDGYTKPEVVSAVAGNNGVPFIDIEEGVHPCVAQTFDGDFIPNDAQLGVADKGQMILLSGPNMGGKSTLLRQTCVLALMAQIGCFVPAQKCRMSPVDRIFTRIGASDRILAGQSTLYVELAETATILQHATSHSLVILDELGRGTSTFDGTAIAYSVVEHLLHHVKCRSMFATHYHSLVEEYTESELVSLGHMGCIVDPANDRKVTFLYKLEDGMCPKSYGLNVAMLAKLPDEVIELAARKSEQFELSLQRKASEHDAEAEELVRKVQQVLAQSSVDVEVLTALWSQLQSA